MKTNENNPAPKTTEELREEAKAYRLERETCSRCGGSGHYSYCQMYGSTCFKCHGKKETLTKRGAAAMKVLTASLRKRAFDFEIGEKLLVEGFSCGSMVVPNRWITIEEIYFVSTRDADRAGKSWTNGVRRYHTQLHIVGVDRYGKRHSTTGHPVETTYRRAVSAEEKVALMKAAKEYEATLTKAGKPRKRRAKAKAK